MSLPLSIYPASTLMLKRGVRFLNNYRHIQQVYMQGKVASSANWQMLEQKGRGEEEGMSRTHSLVRAVKLMGLPSTMLACVSVPFTRSLPADPFPQLHKNICSISMSVPINIGYTMPFLSNLYSAEISETSVQGSKSLCGKPHACCYPDSRAWFVGRFGAARGSNAHSYCQGSRKTLKKFGRCCAAMSLIQGYYKNSYLGAPGTGPHSTATSLAPLPDVAFARLYMAIKLEAFHPPDQLLPIVTLYRTLQRNRHRNF